MTHGEIPRYPTSTTRPLRRHAGIGTLIIGALAICMVAFASPASAAAYEDSVDLGTASAYSVLAGTAATNTGASFLPGDLGVSPGSSATGFVASNLGGATHLADAAAAQAQSDLTTAYDAAAARTPTGAGLGTALVGGTPLLPGVYAASSSLNVGGAVVLDGQGDPNSVFIFQIPASLTTDTTTTIVLTGDAQSCHVFWQVGASAALNTGNTFVGTIMALTSITVATGTTIAGRALARNGDVTLDDNVFTAPTCATTTSVTTTSSTTGGTTTLTAAVTSGGVAAAAGGTVTFTSNGVVVGTAAVGANGLATLVIPVGSTAGTRTVTATFNGSSTLTPSTSASTSLLISATPAPPVTGTTVLPDTGTSDTGTLIIIGASAIVVGLGLTLTRRRRVPAAR